MTVGRFVTVGELDAVVGLVVDGGCEADVRACPPDVHRAVRWPYQKITILTQVEHGLNISSLFV